jgi:hypothetical protein
VIYSTKCSYTNHRNDNQYDNYYQYGGVLHQEIFFVNPFFCKLFSARLILMFQHKQLKRQNIMNGLKVTGIYLAICPSGQCLDQL